MTDLNKQELIERIRECLDDGCYCCGTANLEDDLNAIATAWIEDREKVKQKMAMCTDDRTFLEEHKFANVIEYDEKLKRPSRAMYHNRQWEAERDGLNVLAALGERLANEEQN